jgi:NAD(P)-dependent dehydrogenase (short-subunit alcohol dehydrogenase family)
MNIKDKTALVTGAGSGIGRAAALMLAEAGAAKIIAADINLSSAEETVQQIVSRGAKGVARRIDVSDLAALEELFAEADSAGGLDIVFNNAGIVSGPPQFPDGSVARMVKLVSINLTAMMAGTKFAVEGMRRRGAPGAIVNTASRAALRPSAADPAYTATKAGILMFTRSCADLKERFGIRVNAVCPAITETGMLAATGGSAPAQWLQTAMAQVRILSPEDIARAVLDLIEDESKSGEYILVDNEPAPAQ